MTNSRKLGSALNSQNIVKKLINKSMDMSNSNIRESDFIIRQDTMKTISLNKENEQKARLKIMKHFSKSTLKDVDFINFVENDILCMEILESDINLIIKTLDRDVQFLL